MTRIVIKMTMSVATITALLFLAIGLSECAFHPGGRIVGGVSVKIQDYPYQVSIQSDGDHICGGSLIADSYVLTSAHCTEGRNVDSFTVRVGSSYRDAGGKIIAVNQLFQNPNYNHETVDYDVTIMHLAEAVSSDLGKIVDLASSGDALPYGSKATVTGWGATAEGGNLATQLQKLDVPVIAQDTCEGLYSSVGEITERMFCAGFVEGQKDSCQADSGGPLVYNGKQIGIVSWGYGCARPQYPGVYANVAKLRDYIDSIVN